MFDSLHTSKAKYFTNLQQKYVELIMNAIYEQMNVA